MGEQSLQVAFLAPIPVGHRARLCFYEPDPDAIGWVERCFPSASAEPAALITVEDLTTGILYSAATLWRAQRRRDALDDVRQVYGPRRDESYRLVRELEVVIRGCRVISRSGNANNHRMLTVLSFEASVG